jgi:acyl-CoA thioesterase FadM
MGHLYQGCYHQFLDEARAAVFGDVTGPNGFPFVLASVTVDYRHEVLRADDRLIVETTVGEVGTTSVVLEHRFVRPDGVVVASGRSTMVAFDREARTKRALTEAEREMLAESTA